MSRMTAIPLGIVLLLLFVLSASLFTVAQTEQVLITQFGQPVRVIMQPGLNARIPFVQAVIEFDRRLLDYQSPGEEVILSDQRRLIVDSFTRFRITDPLQYFQAVGPGEDAVRARLNSVVTSSLRRVLGNESLLNVLSAERSRIMNLIRDQVAGEMKAFGVTIEDVRLRRADLPPENTQAILNRMKSERERIAKQQRAEGAEASARIRADADRDKTVLIAEANAQSDKLRGEGEQASTKIFADAYQRDPVFYNFYRTLQAYREVFANGQSRMVLTPDNDFLRLLREPPK